MRVAVVQAGVCPTGRTTTFQAALAAIDAAAANDPAPDLVLLPAFVDVLAVISGRGAPLEAVQGQTAAGCGHRARIWGVFVAFGMAERGSGGPYLSSVLIDRDGDVRLSQRQVCVSKTAGVAFKPGCAHRTVHILLGRIGLLAGDDLFDARAWDAVVSDGAQVVLGSACWTRRSTDKKQKQSIRDRIAEQSKRCGLWCAVADVTTGSGEFDLCASGRSAVFDQTGRMVHVAQAHQATTLWADIPVPGPSVAGENKEEKRSG